MAVSDLLKKSGKLVTTAILEQTNLADANDIVSESFENETGTYKDSQPHILNKVEDFLKPRKEYSQKTTTTPIREDLSLLLNTICFLQKGEKTILIDNILIDFFKRNKNDELVKNAVRVYPSLKKLLQ